MFFSSVDIRTTSLNILGNYCLIGALGGNLSHVSKYMYNLFQKSILGSLSVILYPSVQERSICNHFFIQQGGLSAQAFVRVEVEDMNDNEPVFNPSTYVTSISGQTHSGTEIINVFATDRDSGIYGTVAYKLLPSDLSSLFTIDSTTGM